MIDNPKAYWQAVSERQEWRDYILPRKNAADFDAEGFAEAQRLFYFFGGESTVVDYGCGVARVLKYVAERAGRTIGLDICKGFLDKARPLVPVDNVEFFLSDEYEEQEVADFVLCLMVMQHNTKANQICIMAHIWEILKDKGVALVSFPRYESTYYTENETLHKFKREEIEDFAAAFDYRIIEGNLPGYAQRADGFNEYFLIATKVKGDKPERKL